MVKRSKWIIAPIAAGAAVLAGREPVLAKVIRNTIDPTAGLSARGRIAEGAALLACTEGERVKGAAAFEPGRAEACAVAVDTASGKVVDTRQWCRADGVELVED